MKKHFLAIVGLTAGLTIAASTAMAEFPDRNVGILVPFSAGGGADVPARFLAAEFEKIFGKNFVVSNVSGAGGTVGATQLSKAKPDGYSLGFLPVGTTTTQPHIRKTEYNDKSWEPICLVAQGPLYVTVLKDSPIKTFEELIEKAKSGEVTTAGPPPGSIPHVAQAAVANAYDVKFNYIPHQGINQVIKSMLGGRVTMTAWFGDATERFGLRPLAILDTKRSEDFPDIPTAGEFGTDVVSFVWFGLFAPAGTPTDVVTILSDACGQASETPSFIENLEKAKRQVRYLPTGEFRKFFAEQYKANGQLLRDAGVVK